jgi:hypothetical protein
LREYTLVLARPPYACLRWGMNVCDVPTADLMSRVVGKQQKAAQQQWRLIKKAT